MTIRFRWAAVLFVTAIHAMTAHAQVYYSPVFHMPLQPAPSPSNGGYYWVLPDGRLWGPNYYLVPPFNPISGPNTTQAGQKIFEKVFTQYLRNGSAQIAKTAAHNGNPKNVGVGTYNQDFSDPQSMHAFDQQNSLGFQPFQPPQPPQQPRPASYPTYPSSPGYGPVAYGYGMPAAQPAMMPQVAPVEYYRASYQPNYYGGSQIVPTQGQGPPPPAPAVPPSPPVLGNPRGYGGAPCLPGMPGLPYNPSYSPSMPGLPGLPYTGYNPSLPGLPGLPTPGYTPNMPCPPNQYPTLPSPSYTPVYPRLPSPSYEPPHCPQGCEGGNPGYYHPAGIRSPRDFFMWGDVKEDERLREFKALQIP